MSICGEFKEVLREFKWINEIQCCKVKKPDGSVCGHLYSAHPSSQGSAALPNLAPAAWTNLPPPPLPSVTLEDWLNEPPISRCTVVGVPIPKAPKAVRRRFAKQLIALGESSGRQYGGYVKRESHVMVRAHIVTTDTDSSADLHELWGFLKTFWTMVNPRDITYKNNDFVNVPYLTDRFEVVQPNEEPEDWSYQTEDFDDSASECFSVVSRVPGVY